MRAEDESGESRELHNLFLPKSSKELSEIVFAKRFGQEAVHASGQALQTNKRPFIQLPK